jgi:PAS domain S-box-containing protein
MASDMFEILRMERDLALALASARTSADAIEALVRCVGSMAGVDACAGFVTCADDALKIVAHRGLSKDLVAKGVLPLSAWSELWVHDEGLRALATFAVHRNEHVTALLAVGSRQLDEWPADTTSTLLAVTALVEGPLGRLDTAERVAQNEANLRRLVDALSDCVSVLDETGHVEYFNEAGLRLLGYGLDELLGTSALALHAPDRRTEVAAIVTNILQGTASVSTVPLVTKQGDEVPCESRVTRGEWNGHPALFVVTRDLTERLQAKAALSATEQELRQTEERHRQLFVRASDAMLVVDPVTNRILEANDAAVHLYGYSLDQLCELPVTHLSTASTENAFPTTGSAATAYHQRQDGTIFAAEVTLSTVSLRGRTVVFQAIRDVSDRIRAQAALELRNRDLEEALATIKTLRGLLPICSHCKKIRDDHGYWQGVEEYVMAHSSAAFSHGICPDCASRYYGDLLPQRPQRGG